MLHSAALSRKNYILYRANLQQEVCPEQKLTNYISIKIIRKWKLAHTVGHKGIMMNIFKENELMMMLFTE